MLASSNRDEGGHMLIPSPLTSVQREMFTKRLRAMAPYLGPAKRGDVEGALLELFSGNFANKPASDEEAAATMAAFVRVLQQHSVPLFAIVQACSAWASGTAKPESIGARSIDPRYLPTTAEMCRLAEFYARPHRDEAIRTKMLLEARVQRALTEEERARGVDHVRASMEDYRRQAAAANVEESERRRAREETAERRREEQLAADNERRRREFADRGLEPVYTNASRTVVTSLSLLLSMGYRIEETPDGNALVRPGEAAIDARWEDAQ